MTKKKFVTIILVHTLDSHLLNIFHTRVPVTLTRRHACREMRAALGGRLKQMTFKLVPGC